MSERDRKRREGGRKGRRKQEREERGSDSGEHEPPVMELRLEDMPELAGAGAILSQPKRQAAGLGWLAADDPALSPALRALVLVGSGPRRFTQAAWARFALVQALFVSLAIIIEVTGFDSMSTALFLLIGLTVGAIAGTGMLALGQKTLSTRLPRDVGPRAPASLLHDIVGGSAHPLVQALAAQPFVHDHKGAHIRNVQLPAAVVATAFNRVDLAMDALEEEDAELVAGRRLLAEVAPVADGSSTLAQEQSRLEARRARVKNLRARLSARRQELRNLRAELDAVARNRRGLRRTDISGLLHDAEANLLEVADLLPETVR